LESTLEDMLYSYKQAESQVLASYILRDTARVTKAADRGTRRAGFNVLRNTLVPSALVEVGYLSNSKEESLLNSTAYRQKMADGLADSIKDYVTR
jgi:N-acetylmuramoyl-L-alanine amidase